MVLVGEVAPRVSHGVSKWSAAGNRGRGEYAVKVERMGRRCHGAECSLPGRSGVLLKENYMATRFIAYGVEIYFRDREILTVPITMSTGYMVSSVSGDPDDLVTFGTFNRDLYLRWRSELDRAGRSYTHFEPE